MANWLKYTIGICLIIISLFALVVLYISYPYASYPEGTDQKKIVNFLEWIIPERQKMTLKEKRKERLRIWLEKQLFGHEVFTE